MTVFASVSIKRRCAKCGSMVTSDTIAHGSLLGGKPLCSGKGAGRTRVCVWLRPALVLRRTGEAVPHPWKGRKATPAEVKALASVVAEAKTTGRTIIDRDVSEVGISI